MAALAPLPLPAIPSFRLGRTLNVKDLDLATFSPHVKTLFRLHRSEAPCMDLELVEAQERLHRAMPGVPMMETFSLLFRGPVGDYISQNTYEFSHPEIGTFSIFITPVIGSDQEGYYYQALFSRIVTQTELQPETKEII